MEAQQGVEQPAERQGHGEGGGVMNDGPRRWAEAQRKGEAAADSRGDIAELYSGSR